MTPGLKVEWAYISKEDNLDPKIVDAHSYSYFKREKQNIMHWNIATVNNPTVLLFSGGLLQ